jgi:CRP-like cAMP-binding protein
MNSTLVRTYQAGERVIEEGHEGDEMFIVLTGAVRVHTGEAALTRLGPGQQFGEMALIDNAPRTASVVSEGISKLMIMRRRDFFDIVRKDHDVAVKLLWSFMGVLTDRLRTTTRDLAEAREQLVARNTTPSISNELVVLSDSDLEEA